MTSRKLRQKWMAAMTALVFLFLIPGAGFTQQVTDQAAKVASCL